MNPERNLSLLRPLASLLLLASVALANDERIRSVDDTGSPALYSPDLDRAIRDVSALAPSRGIPKASIASPVQINLVFHVLSGPASEGDLSDAILAQQLSVLNEAYRTTGYHFTLAQVRRHPDSPYFAGGCFPTTESGLRMKAELAVDPARYVNIYTCRLDLPYIAGYGTLPDEFPESDPRHGVVIDYGTVPGSAAPLGLGHTLVHELGHYFGLLHTFQGGCDEPGDSIQDTPAEAAPAFGCPMGRDSCAQAGADPVSNYMDYSDDTCTDRFTPLQGTRMRTLTAAYRPSLVAAAFAIGPGITGNWYNPAQSGHGFSLEVLAGNQLLAEWFVFGPGGGATWINAIGPISGDSALLQAYQETGSGGRFPPNFDANRLQQQPWGTIEFRFADCNNGNVSWQSNVAGYASGSMAITRVTTPLGLTCP